MASELIRLDKAAARVFDLTRSQVQALIKSGALSLDGRPLLSPSEKIPLNAVLSYDGDEYAVAVAFKPRVFMLNKPGGLVCADRDNNAPVVVNLFLGEPRASELHCVGRLDIDTTGLLLVTDDGTLSHKITSPKYAVKKVYLAGLKNPLKERDIGLFARGLKHPEEKERYRPCLLEIVSDKEGRVSVTEGRFHEVKRLFECVGNEVIALKREQIGELKLDPNLEEGEYRLLSDDELKLLFEKA